MTLKTILFGAASALVLSAGAANAVPATAETSLNVRSGPGTQYEVVGTIRAGETVDAGNCTGSWCRVSFSGGTGFANRSYLAMGGGGPAVAVAPGYAYERALLRRLLRLRLRLRAERRLWFLREPRLSLSPRLARRTSLARRRKLGRSSGRRKLGRASRRWAARWRMGRAAGRHQPRHRAGHRNTAAGLGRRTAWRRMAVAAVGHR